MAGETVKIPGDGQVSRRWLLIGGGLTVGILGFAWWRAGRAGAAPSDEALTEQPSDLGPADVAGVSSGGGVTDTGAVFITTNAQWTQAAVAALVDLGYDAIQVTDALGKYLAGQQVTLQEATWIQAAVALVGKPPIGEHSIRLFPTGSTTPPATEPGPPAPTNKLQQQHQYVPGVHEFSRDTPVRDAVRRFSDPIVATPNAVEWATRLTMRDPRNAGDIRNGIILKQRRVYVYAVKIKITRAVS
jgi:hypothetical protein